MKIRSLGIMILFVGGLLIPCLLLTTVIGTPRVAPVISNTIDTLWISALDQSLNVQGIDVLGIEIQGEEGLRTLVVSVEGPLWEEMSPSELMSEIHDVTANGLVDWPFSAEQIGTLVVWVFPEGERPYAVVVGVQPLVRWKAGETEWADYVKQWSFTGNAPVDLTAES